MKPLNLFSLDFLLKDRVSTQLHSVQIQQKNLLIGTAFNMWFHAHVKALRRQQHIMPTKVYPRPTNSHLFLSCNGIGSMVTTNESCMH